MHVQRAVRGWAGRRHVAAVRRAFAEVTAVEAARWSAATTIQAVARASAARQVWRRLQAERRLEELRWEMAVLVQRAWRAKRARLYVTVLRLLRREACQQAAALTLQAFWRACRARHMAAIHKALYRLRLRQTAAAVTIQRMYRGMVARRGLHRHRKAVQAARQKEHAALAIQRVYRGHRGRERWEVHDSLRRLERQARPLQQKIDELEQQGAAAAAALRAGRAALVPLAEREATLREEVVHATNTKDRFTDSDKVTGTRQRFLTKFLQQRLFELAVQNAQRLAAQDCANTQLEARLRKVDRQRRQAERELLPLREGTAGRTQLERSARLRARVRATEAGSRLIQRVFRGWRVRRACRDPLRLCWCRCEDEATGDSYWYNTATGRATWIRPLDAALFGAAGYVCGGGGLTQ
ncbi:unnamed protein product [Phaeothamnion confervicola]